MRQRGVEQASGRSHRRDRQPGEALPAAAAHGAAGVPAAPKQAIADVSGTLDDEDHIAALRDQIKDMRAYCSGMVEDREVFLSCISAQVRVVSLLLQRLSAR